MKTKDLKNEFEKLIKIMETLRGPDGCPWDKEQDYYSLQPYILEEAYEVIETLKHKDIKSLKEELGDLLLQVVFQAQIGREKNDFDIVDVIKTVNKKLIRRHPHVFSDKKVDNVGEVLSTWEEIKEKEKNEKQENNKQENNYSTSILDDVSNHQPALNQSFEIQEKASEVGFDWDKVENVIAKIKEELNELNEAIEGESKERIEDEIGDLLFATVNLSRFYDINPELSLISSILKFKKRFQFIENKVDQSGKSFKDFTLRELDKFWEESKKNKKK